jgi:hypothetical protein
MSCRKHEHESNTRPYGSSLSCFSPAHGQCVNLNCHAFVAGTTKGLVDGRFLLTLLARFGKVAGRAAGFPRVAFSS